MFIRSPGLFETRLWAVLYALALTGLVEGFGIACRSPMRMISRDGGSQVGDTAAANTGPSIDACGRVFTFVQPLPPDVFLIIDRSASMSFDGREDCSCIEVGVDSPCSDRTCTPRWSSLRSALASLTSSLSGLRWGLAVVPAEGDGTCPVSSSPDLPLDEDQVTAIRGRMDSSRPGGASPLAAAIDSAARYLANLRDENSKMIVLATDGAANCVGDNGGANDPASSSGLAAALNALASARAKGFAVFVLGVGPHATELTAMAQAGGMRQFYPAESPNQLAHSLYLPPEGSCAFAVPGIPSEPDQVSVYLNEELVPRDPDNGWIGIPNGASIRFVGSACERTLASKTVVVRLVWKCNTSSLDVLP